MPQRVVLSATARVALANAMRDAAPAETVGLLGGTVGAEAFHVTAFALLPGVGADADHFTVTGAAFAAGEAALRARGLDWLGFAHSHATGSAQPSGRDRRDLWPGCLHVIIAPGHPEPQLVAFRLHDQAVNPLPLEFA